VCWRPACAGFPAGFLAGGCFVALNRLSISSAGAVLMGIELKSWNESWSTTISSGSDSTGAVSLCVILEPDGTRWCDKTYKAVCRSLSKLFFSLHNHNQQQPIYLLIFEFLVTHVRAGELWVIQPSPKLDCLSSFACSDLVQFGQLLPECGHSLRWCSNLPSFMGLFCCCFVVVVCFVFVLFLFCCCCLGRMMDLMKSKNKKNARLN